MRKFLLVGTILTELAVPAAAYEATRFPAGCSLPGATITSKTGVDTQHADMTARIERRDIIGVTHDGCGSGPQCQVSIPAFLGKVWHARANCRAGTVSINLNGSDVRHYQPPIQENCAEESFQAVEAFQMLCPNYRGKIEKEF